MRTVTFFNNKGGVGKTSLIYHLAWMFSDLGKKVVAVDLDPQANLTAAFLDENKLETLWMGKRNDGTVFSCIRPLLEGTGDIGESAPQQVGDGLWLLAGDLALSRFEDELSGSWPKCLDGEIRAFRVISAFWRLVANAVTDCGADFAFIDVGPNLGAINRSALIASDNVIVPLAPDLFSLQGLRNLGPTLRRWRQQWKDRLNAMDQSWALDLPRGDIDPIGYVVLQHAVRLDRPTKAYEKWMTRIPRAYREAVLDDHQVQAPPMSQDPHCLAQMKHYRSLMPLAQEARKPVFHLKPADGAIGSHAQAANDARNHFQDLADKIAGKIFLNV